MDKILDTIKMLNSLQTYDITPVLHTNISMYTASPLQIVKDFRTHDVHGFYLQTLIIGEHVGTHIDAACHTVKGAPSIESYAADYFIAPYKKYALDVYHPMPGEEIDLDKIFECEKQAGFSLEEGDIVLLQYGFDKYFFEEERGEKPTDWYNKNAPGISDKVCEYFVSKKIRAIGADTNNCECPQIDGNYLNLSGHNKYFLPNNIPIMENFVNMEKAPATGIFLALPLPILNGSGSPVRAILKA